MVVFVKINESKMNIIFNNSIIPPTLPSKSKILYTYRSYILPSYDIPSTI